jgi:RimJ/RimL family protein N-acetyltransferase
MSRENKEDTDLLPSPSSPGLSKYFSHRWTISVPSHPSLRFFRATPSHFDVWIPIVTNPENRKMLPDTRDKVWDEAAVAEWKEAAEARYTEANTKFNKLEVLIELDGRVAGYGNIVTIREDAASVGLVLERTARGRGVGKLAMAVLIQLGFAFGLQLEPGTMKANGPMRGVMASLGVAEEEELVVIPGRGVVAEVVYRVRRERWREVEMRVVFDEEEGFVEAKR